MLDYSLARTEYILYITILLRKQIAQSYNYNNDRNLAKKAHYDLTWKKRRKEHAHSTSYKTNANFWQKVHKAAIALS